MRPPIPGREDATVTLLSGVEWSGRIFSGGWVPAQGGTIQTVEPATGEVLAEVGLANKGDVATAAERARAAQPAWAAQTGPERAALIRRAARILEDNHEEFETWLVREGGAVPGKAGFEVQLVLGELWEAAALPTQPWGALLPSSEPGRESVARRLPLGVVGVISPWNFPQILSVRAVAPALALGNAVILKPDVHTPVSGGVLIARLFEEAGLPADLLHMLPGDAEAGTALSEDPNVAMISFTGSTAVGRLVGAAAGRTLKRVSLELGGNNALIVLDDADLEVASSAGAWSAFLHQGQVCMTAGRHIVLESVADEYLERLAQRASGLPVGDPNLEQVALGPLINEQQLRRVDRIVTETVEAGAQIRAGGTHDRLFYAPTVLANVTTQMPAFREEIFGPVAPVVIVKDDAEAVAVANDTEYGLVAAIQTGSRDRGRAVADQLTTGIVHVNDQTLNNDAYAPFGGTGASGNGARFGSQSSWDEFTHWQWLTLRDQPHGFPF
jgi:benzaldehyde dehydrogenase (NAD)